VIKRLSKVRPRSLLAEKQPLEDPLPAPEAKITVALVMKTLTNPFFVEMEKGARQAEAASRTKSVFWPI
jgi:ABC-type sugar transport system substrate-binding protein